MYKKGMFILFAVAFFVVIVPSVISAETSNTDSVTEKPPDATSDDLPGFHEVDEIRDAGVRITSQPNSIGLSGWTQTFRIESVIGVDLTLQRWNPGLGRWQDYSIPQRDSVLNDSRISVSYSVSPPRGYFYRVKGYHWANATANGFTTYSQSIRYE